MRQIGFSVYFLYFVSMLLVVGLVFGEMMEKAKASMAAMDALNADLTSLQEVGDSVDR